MPIPPRCLWVIPGIKDGYKVEINNEIWDDITIGAVTTAIVTAEDLQAMAEEESSGTSE